MASISAPTPASFDLTQMHVMEALFLECTIAFEPTEVVTEGPYQFEVTNMLLEPAFDMAQAKVTYLLHVAVRQIASNGTSTGATGSFRIRFVFIVKNMAEYSRTSPDYEGAFPVRDLMIMLGGVAYSTSRGLLLAQTASTILNGFALPLRSPQDIFQESITVLANRNKEHSKPKRIPAKRKPKAQ